MTELSFHSLASGQRMAYRHHPASGPLIVFLPGYMSDMAGSKAMAVMAQAEATGSACLLLDYTGCGQSDGDFADGTLSQWRDEVIALVDNVSRKDQPLLLVGSSMGGWLMLLIARAIPHRIAGLVGIAAAPDFTSWGYDDMLKAQLARGQTIHEPNPYGLEPTPTHAAFWADGEANLLLDDAIALTIPVRLLHGQRDDDVPYHISLKLAAALRSDDVQVTLIKDGDHRLSRDADIALLRRIIFELVDTE